MLIPVWDDLVRITTLCPSHHRPHGKRLRILPLPLFANLKIGNVHLGVGGTGAGASSSIGSGSGRPQTSVSTNSDSTSTTTNSTNATSATSWMIIPKSTIAEEDIEVPYGREVRDTAIDNRDCGVDAGVGSRFGGGSRTGRALDMCIINIGANTNTSAGGTGAGATGDAEDQEKLLQDYEYKIATMQTRITGLECDYLGGKGEREKWENRWLVGEERVREEELVCLSRFLLFLLCFFCLFCPPPFVLCPPLHNASY
jgi:hypothetical protein